METNTLTEAYSKKVKALRGKKFVVRPIYRKGGWVPPGHDSSFMNDGSKFGIVVPVLKGNVLVNPLVTIDNNGEKSPFDQKDVELLARELGLPDAVKLNIYVPKSFWRGNTVFLDRNGLHINTAYVEDFIKYLILRSDTDRIAPNWGSRFDRGTYKFALVEEGEELQDKVSNLEEKKNAYILFGKIDSNIEKMKDFLYVYYLQKKDAKRPPRNATINQLKEEIGRIIEDDLKTFLSILEDDNYTLKLLIQKSVEIGALRRDKHLYSVPGSDRPIGTIEDLITHLDDPEHQDLRIKLMHHVENVNTTKE